MKEDQDTWKAQANDMAMNFRDIYMKAAANMPKGSIQEMEAKMRPILETFKDLNYHLQETKRNYVREKARSALLLQVTAHFREQADVLASEHLLKHIKKKLKLLYLKAWALK